MKRSRPDRDWFAAREKVEEEGRCRVCRNPFRLEAAHIIGREHDQWRPYCLNREPWHVERWQVCGVRIVPLCIECHRAYDAHQLDVLHVLSLEEQLQAVRDAGSVESMRRRTAPTAYRPVPKGRAA